MDWQITGISHLVTYNIGSESTVLSVIASEAEGTSSWCHTGNIMVDLLRLRQENSD